MHETINLAWRLITYSIGMGQPAVIVETDDKHKRRIAGRQKLRRSVFAATGIRELRPTDPFIEELRESAMRESASVGVEVFDQYRAMCAAAQETGSKLPSLFHREVVAGPIVVDMISCNAEDLELREIKDGTYVEMNSVTLVTR